MEDDYYSIDSILSENQVLVLSSAHDQRPLPAAFNAKHADQVVEVTVPGPHRLDRLDVVLNEYLDLRLLPTQRQHERSST